nr:transposase [Endozoicomonas numazuensis]
MAKDMWKPYINAVMHHVPEAHTKIAFDKFHVAQHLGNAVNKVRLEEHKSLMTIGSGVLKGTKYDWLTNPDNMTDEKWDAFESLRYSNLKTARAWSIKETAMSQWDYKSRAWTKKAWARWLSWAQRCRLEPMKKAAKTVKEHLWGIINAIVLKADNGRSEGLNGKIQRLKGRAYGYRNRERFKTAIYFHCGGLELYPVTAKR